jgi:hypothetical protein
MSYTVCTAFGPKPGHEMQLHLALKHRHQAFELMKRIGRNPFAFRAYDRAFKLWAMTIPRTYEHGEMRSWVV